MVCRQSLRWGVALGTWRPCCTSSVVHCFCQLAWLGLSLPVPVSLWAQGPVPVFRLCCVGLCRRLSKPRTHGHSPPFPFPLVSDRCVVGTAPFGWMRSTLVSRRRIESILCVFGAELSVGPVWRPGIRPHDCFSCGPALFQRH